MSVYSYGYKLLSSRRDPGAWRLNTVLTDLLSTAYRATWLLHAGNGEMTEIYCTGLGFTDSGQRSSRYSEPRGWSDIRLDYAWIRKIKFKFKKTKSSFLPFICTFLRQ